MDKDVPIPFEEQGLLYSTRVLMGNWFERRVLDDYKNQMGFRAMRHLERYRTMVENVHAPVKLSISMEKVIFGQKIMLVAPYILSTPCPLIKTKGMSLGSRVSPNYLPYAQDFRPNFRIIGYKELEPLKKNTFIINQLIPDCSNDVLRYYQPFTLTLAATVDEDKTPLHVRYIVNPMPGVTDPYPLELCDKPECATPWRILPVRRSDITREEQEGDIVPPNTDVIINHCATNINLGMEPDIWIRDYYGHIAVPIVKTYVDVHKRELPNNIWQLRTELPQPEEIKKKT